MKKQAAASQDGKDHWWQAGRLNVKNSLLAPEFINIVEADELQHENQVEAKLAWKLAFWGLLFFPLSIASYRIANGAIVTEPNNSYSRKAKIMAIISFGFTVGMGYIPLIREFDRAGNSDIKKVTFFIFERNFAVFF